MDDERRLERFVREVLIQKDMVLLYIPGVILVLSSRWALERVRMIGSNFVASDAKVDTVLGTKMFWSSIRFEEPGRGASNIACAWIAEVENHSTIEMAARALKHAVRCNDNACEHALTHEHSVVHGVHQFRMTRVCHTTNNFRPGVCHDKHWESFIGFCLIRWIFVRGGHNYSLAPLHID